MTKHAQQTNSELSGAQAREQLVAATPLTDGKRTIAGIETAILEGGDGPPIVLLHGPGEYAAKWVRVAPELAKRYRVVAPDLPGHGESQPIDAPTPERMFEWLGDLIAQTCETPPALVGQILGGAIAARFAAKHGDRIGQLVLADALGLAGFQPAPEFGGALQQFMQQPTPENHDALWEQCSVNLGRLQQEMGDMWTALRAYNLHRAASATQGPAVLALMEQFGFPPIPEAELEAISVPTTLVWGRCDLATDVGVAEAASKRYGWPLHVIDDAADDPPIDQPDAFVRALNGILDAGAPS